VGFSKFGALSIKRERSRVAVNACSIFKKFFFKSERDCDVVDFPVPAKAFIIRSLQLMPAKRGIAIAIATAT